MDNIKIDYTTLNLIFEVTHNNKKYRIFINPCNKEDIEDNALVLGKYYEVITENAYITVLKDYKAHIKNINSSKLGDVINMLDRGILGAYVFIDDKPIKLEASILKDSEEVKEYLRGSLLFFTVLFRYYGWGSNNTIIKQMIDYYGVTTTLLSALEYKPTLSTPTLEKETI